MPESPARRGWGYESFWFGGEKAREAGPAYDKLVWFLCLPVSQYRSRLCVHT
jgi:hypothetical protein